MRRLVRSLFLLALGAFAYFAYAERDQLAPRVAAFLIVDQPRQRADAIVVLGGSLPDRILEAVDIYKAGMAPRIVLGREPASPGIDELRRRGGRMLERDEVNVAIAEQLGVPKSALVVVDGRPTSTLAEAWIIIPYLRRVGAKRVILVSSKIHTRRAGLTYRAHAPEIEFTTCASRFDPFDPQSWWEIRGNVRRVFFEYQKLLVFLVRDRWTKPEPPPGLTD
jgi:uncharacterized SAM-binding protein YcdF (DUF218 family)